MLKTTRRKALYSLPLSRTESVRQQQQSENKKDSTRYHRPQRINRQASATIGFDPVGPREQTDGTKDHANQNRHDPNPPLRSRLILKVHNITSRS
jgi:hypothetical protein